MARKDRKKKKEEEEYDVEDIVAKRINGGVIEYLVKWYNYPSEQNTWEPIDNLEGSQEIINEYEVKHSGESVPEVDAIEPGNGFNQKWVPIKVFGATKRPVDGRLMVMIRWKGNKSSFEFAEEANTRIPQLVIAYYEQRIRWKTGNRKLERNICYTNTDEDIHQLVTNGDVI
ncbi:chromobox protein homolog 1-like [Oppia nitens]|uniref:chromobox protein homolog 1-like n=1 Tax=Oppia nitens TaxID=1686743 RepID=UPI0023DC4315|nr:chromobox protein homolog 1-like [Oppia nitens]